MAAHEDLSRHEGIRASSDRAFGFVMTGFFALLGLWPLVRSQTPRFWAVWLAGAFLLFALFAPAALRPLNLIWTGLGGLLHRVMNPIVTGLIFYAAFFPMGLLMRAFGKDPMRLAYDPGSDSYWIRRQPPGPPPDSMLNQF